MSVRFWGVRGGIASPGARTEKFGGNTLCLEVKAGQETFVIDCGTGARELGASLMGKGAVKVHLLLTDYCWDHLQGFPFFTPVYLPSSEIQVHGPMHGDKGVREMLSEQMKFPVFPIQLSDLRAKFTFDTLKPGGLFEVGRKIRVSTFGLPSGGLAYRIENGRHSLVFLPDDLENRTDPALFSFCAGASVMVMNGRPAGLPAVATRLARSAHAKRLLISHHAPDADDRALRELERRARRDFAGARAAYEGLYLAL